MQRLLLRSSLLVLVLLFCIGNAYADKEAEIVPFKEVVNREYVAKPWSLLDAGILHTNFADSYEAEPNDVCPGNAYTIDDVFHGAINLRLQLLFFSQSSISAP